MNVGSHVGFRVGFLGLPDKTGPSVVNSLSGDCRKCRAFKGEESPTDCKASAAPAFECPGSRQSIESIGLE